MVRLDRRTGALLAYLALEGPTPRARLVGLLWPDSPEWTARANLRQLLRRLRVATEAELVGGKDVLSLTPALEAGSPEALLGRGTPLDGLELPDAEALCEWIERTRASLLDRRRNALLQEHLEREGCGDLDGALGAARSALELDPYSEEAHRRVMRSYALKGDRAAALATFEACREMLQREFGVQPSEETAALAAELSKVAPPRRTVTPAPARLPLSILRPPVFVGRAREWEQMEEAWAAGRGILLCGAPGMGKTRLMQEFLAHHGGAVTFAARPGDAGAAYGTHARTYRQLLDAMGPMDLPAWIRRELARIIPSLGPAAPPLQSAADKLRFFQAKLEVHRLAYLRGLRTLGFDDLQYVDAASAEAGHYILSQLQHDRIAPVKTIHCFRTGSLDGELQARLREAGFGDQFRVIDLAPLAEAEVRDLVEGLELEELPSAAVKDIAHRSAGNPAAALELVKTAVTQQPLRRVPAVA